MIEKFDFTRLICMGGNMSTADFEESERLKWLVNDDHKNLDYKFEQARFFASKDDDIHTIISYCYIIKIFDSNLTAYEELTEYLYFHNYFEWAIITAMEGSWIRSSKKLKELLKKSSECREQDKLLKIGPN